MKNIILIISLLVSSVSYSQVITFKVDTFTRFKIPSYMGMNEASRANKIEYFGLGSHRKNVWIIDLGRKTIKIGKNNPITMIEVHSDLNEKWVCGQFYSEIEKKIVKFIIGIEKKTNNYVFISTVLDDDITKQRGFFTNPIELTINN